MYQAYATLTLLLVIFEYWFEYWYGGYGFVGDSLRRIKLKITYVNVPNTEPKWRHTVNE